MAYPVTNEIVTLAEVKALTNISVTTYDTFISALIPTICRAIENYCRRRFVKSNWTQWFPIEDEVITDNWPINNVLVVGVPYEAVLITDTSNSLNFAVTQTTSNNIQVDSKLIVTDTSALTSTEYLFSTYTTLGALKIAVEAAHATVTFTYQTVQSPIVFSTISTQAIRATVGNTLIVGCNYFEQSTSDSIGDIYRLSDDSDRLFLGSEFLNWCTDYCRSYNCNTACNYPTTWYEPSSNIMLIYNAGYTTANMPQELKWIVASIISDYMAIYDIQGYGLPKNIMKSETIGDYSYSLGGSSNYQWGIGTTEGIAGLLNKYHDQLDSFKKKFI